jgi:hypothetical protein
MYKKVKAIFLIILISILFFPLFTKAQWGDQKCPTGQTCLQDPLNNKYIGDNGVNSLIGTVISAVLGIVGSLALAMFIYGGFVWMTAAGNKASVDKGKDIITWAALGLIVIFSAYALVNFILTRVIGGAAT